MRRFVIFILFFSLSTFTIAQTPVAEKGVIDLRNWDFDKNISLEGEWEFYWQKLYTPEDFKDKVRSPDAYLKVPGVWTNQNINGKNLPDTGFATYRLIFFVNQDLAGENFSLLINEILCSYKVFVNGKEVAQVGNVAENSSLAKPKVKIDIGSFIIPDERNEIIVQVANYWHRDNSFDEAPVLGREKNIYKLFTKRIAIDLIIFGFLIIMTFYHFGLFILRPKNKAALVFALLTFVLAIRVLFTGNYVIQYFFPAISWRLSYSIAYFTFYALPPLFLSFFQFTYPDKKYDKLSYVVYGISILFILTIILPPIIYTKILIFYQIFTLLIIFFAVFRIIKLLIDKKSGAGIIFVSFLIFFATGVNDMLYFQNIIHTTSLFPFGMFALILGQSLSLARIFTKAFTDNEKLTAELDYHNKHLQELVDERTKEIMLQQQDIMQKNEELQAQKEELLLQRDEINKQREKLLEHNEIITSSINYASTIQQAILPDNDTIKKYFSSFIIFMPKDIVSGDFYWFSDKNQKYLFFAVGDCTGHGVPGAFLSIIAMYMLNTVIVEKEITEPDEIIFEIEKLFFQFMNKSTTNNRDGMELGIMRFDKDNTLKLSYASAKTNLAIYFKEKDEIFRYKGTRKYIGYRKLDSFPEHNDFEKADFVLSPDDIVYCFSDGFVDQNNDERKRFGTQRLLETFKKIAKLPIQQQKVSLINSLKKFMQNQPQRDDITIIGLKHK